MSEQEKPARKKFWSEEENNIVEKICDKVFRIFSIFAIISTVIIMVITVVDVVSRLLFDVSVKGVMEYTQFLMVFVCYCAMPWVTWQFGHIKVDLLTDKMPQKVQHVLLVVDKLACMLFTMLMCYEVWKQGAQANLMHSVGAVTRIPVAPFYYITSVMLGVVVVAMFVNMLSLAALGKEKNRK